MRVLFLALGFLLSSSAFAQAVTYSVDPSHASLVFKVRHLGFANVYGTISGIEGVFVFDQTKPENSKIDISAKVETINTNEKKRDDHLRGPDFFNVKQFPKIVLKSKSIKKVADKRYEVAADLTMHGKTAPLIFFFDLLKVGKDPWGKERIAGETAFTLNRSAFNMTYMNKPEELGDGVDVIVSLEGVKP